MYAQGEEVRQSEVWRAPRALAAINRQIYRNIGIKKLRIRAGLHARQVHHVVEHDVRRRVRRHLNARLDSKRAYGNVLHFNLPAGMRRGAATLDGVGPANCDLCSLLGYM